MTVQHRKNLLTSLLGLALATSLLSLAAWAQTPLDPATIPHFVEQLWTPPKTMPKVTNANFTGDYYEIAARQKTQQILPTGFPSTTVWAFGPNASAATSDDFHTPALTIVGVTNTQVRVKWINDLKDSAGNFFTYPATVPIQQGKHWANPTGVCDGNTRPPDCQGQSKTQYTGPVPIAVHLHGSHTWSNSDGIPESWFLPAGAGTKEPFTRGSDWSQICQGTVEVGQQCTVPPAVVDGAAFFDYPNNQPPGLLFFHDHTLGITAENIVMGLVGPYLLRGVPGVDDLPAGQVPSGPYEIPLVIQDRSFNTDGSISHLSDDGNTIVVNGKTWPYLNVEPRRYRFRVVLGTDSVFLGLRFTSGLKFTQIGNDSGFLPAPVSLSTLNLAPGERADVIVDFTPFKGKNIVLQADGDVLQFRVGTTVTGTDTTANPNTLTLLPEGPICNPSCGTVPVRKVSLAGTLLGTINSAGQSVPKLWDSPTTETPVCGGGGCNNAPAVEEWDIYNFGGDSHPIHLHEVRFEVIDRVSTTTGAHTPPTPGEGGHKDTVVAKGHSILRLRVKFDLAGLYAWHCHMTSHEDDEMMRPMCIVDPLHPVPCNPN